MTTQIPVFEDSMTVGEAVDVYVQKLRLGLYDKHYIYVVDRNRRAVGYIDPKTLFDKA